MAYKGLIVGVHADFVPPKEVIAKAMELYPDAFGAAMPDVATDVVHVVCAAVDKDSKVELEGEQGIMAILENSKAVPRVLYFGKNEGGFHEDDLQPYLIVTDESGDKTHIAVFLEGDFVIGEKPGTPHSNEYGVVNDLLGEKVQAIWEQQGNDITKTMNVLDSALVRKEFQAICLPRGHIVFIAGDNQVHRNHHGQKPVDPEWGWLSHPLEIEQMRQENTEKAKSSNPLDMLKASVKKLTGDKQPPAEPPVKTDGPKADTAIPSEAGKDDRMVEIKGHDRTARKKFIKRNFNLPNGELPKNWETVKEMPYSQLKAGSGLRDRDLQSGMAEAKGIVEHPTVVPPGQLESFNKKVPSIKLEELKTLQELEETDPTFFENTGLAMSDVLRYPKSAYLGMIKDEPRLANNLMNDMRNMCLKAMAKYPDIFKEPDDEEEEAAPAATAGKINPLEVLKRQQQRM